MTFYDYVVGKADEDTPTGDLARDLRADTAAQGMDSYDALRKHLSTVGAGDRALALLDAAHEEYGQQ